MEYRYVPIETVFSNNLFHTLNDLVSSGSIEINSLCTMKQALKTYSDSFVDLVGDEFEKIKAPRQAIGVEGL